MNDNTDHYQGALLEEMHDDIKRISEGMGALSGVPADVRRLKTDMVDVKADLKVIRAVVTAQSSDLKNIDKRVTKLEQTTA